MTNGVIIERVEMVSWFDNRIYDLFALNESQPIKAYSVTTVLGVAPKPFLSTWRGTIGNEQADRKIRLAQDRGSRVHHACYLRATGGVVLFEREAQASYGRPSLELQSQQQKNKRIIAQCIDQGIDYMVLHDQRECYQLFLFSRWLEVVKIGKPEIRAAEFVVWDIENPERAIAGTGDYLALIKAGEYTVPGLGTFSYPETGFYVCDLKIGREDQFTHPLQTAKYAQMVTRLMNLEVVGTSNIYTDLSSDSYGAPKGKITVQGKESFPESLKMFDNLGEIFWATHPMPSTEDLQFPTVYYGGPELADIPTGFMVEDMRPWTQAQEEAAKLSQEVPIVATNDDEVKRATIVRVRDLLYSVYGGKTDADMKGRQNLLTRAFGMEVKGVMSIGKLALEDMQKGLTQLEADVQRIKGNREAPITPPKEAEE